MTEDSLTFEQLKFAFLRNRRPLIENYFHQGICAWCYHKAELCLIKAKDGIFTICDIKVHIDALDTCKVIRKLNTQEIFALKILHETFN